MRRRAYTCCFPLLLCAALAQADVCQVTPTGAPTAAWAGAMTLQAALGNATCSEVWVMRGVYTPGTSQNDSFDVRPGVAVYGGFAGTEASRDDRDPAANVTVLSGDIAGDDANTDGNSIDETSADIVGDNSVHVVTMNGAAGTPVVASTVLDGVTITGGDADGDIGRGGGLYCDGTYAGSECSPTIRNTVFSGNRAANGGALYDMALFGGTSSPRLDHVRFLGNHATGSGGAVYNQGQQGTSSPDLVDVVFAFNQADGYGGALFDFGGEGLSSPTLRRVLFRGNTAGISAGAMYNQGSGGESSPVLTNVTFSGNSSGYSGGALINNGSYGGISSPTLSFVTFTANSTGSGGGTAMTNNGLSGISLPRLGNVILWGDTSTDSFDAEIYNNVATPSIDHSIVRDSGGSGTGWDAAFGSDGGGNLDADPMLYALADNGGFSLTHAIPQDSPARNAGDPGFASPPGPGSDQRGSGYSRAVGGTVDIGAFESQGPSDGDIIFHNGFDPPGSP